MIGNVSCKFHTFFQLQRFNLAKNIFDHPAHPAHHDKWGRVFSFRQAGVSPEQQRKVLARLHQAYIKKKVLRKIVSPAAVLEQASIGDPAKLLPDPQRHGGNFVSRDMQDLHRISTSTLGIRDDPVSKSRTQAHHPGEEETFCACVQLRVQEKSHIMKSHHRGAG
ncbi:MAG: hypothetical protein A2W35_07645 [Chloroflexi bacterium RBG_16_57_11]|nr:MAG: hypothetical protein A2W35_07645 [Chloroflexi bacterium RBG_16_57_11]